MKAYQIMEAILEELDKRTKNEKGEETTRKRSDHGASWKERVNWKEEYPNTQGESKNEVENLKRRAKKLYKAIDHYNTYAKEHGQRNSSPYKDNLDYEWDKVKRDLRYTKSEALDIMEEILLEASPLEVKRRIANKFKDKIGDIYNKAVEDDKKNSEEKMNLHNKIHGEGGNTVVVMGDKIEDFSDNPEIRKDQEKFNEVTDKSKKSGEKVHKLGNLKNLVDYYKNEALEVNEDKEAALSQLRNEYDKEAENIPNGSKEMYELNKKYGKLKKKVDKHFDKNEALELTEAIINEFTEADKKEAAKKVLPERKKEYLSKYADVLDAADEVGSENVPDGNLKDLERAEKRYKHAKKVANEALSLAESIIGYADNIFELDYENKQNVNTNKIRKLKKDKDGENVEVVSVADELFPYEGNAKQQFNQKVLAKINDMIEGKGSLEDLIQFVRKYSGNKKVANEKLHEAIELMEDLYSKIKSVHGEPKYEGSDSHPANKSAELLDKMDKAKYQERKEAVAREKKPEETLGQATYRVLGRRDPLDTVRGKQDSIVKYKKSGHEGVNPSSLKEVLEILEKYTQEQRKEAAKKVSPERKREYLSKYADVLDAADEVGSENVPQGNMKDLERAEKRYKDAEKIANEALQDQVDKKVANREISLDKAFELEKKIKDKISPEKQAEDTKERFRRMAKKLGINPDEKSFRKAINRAKREGRWTQAFYKVSKDGKAVLPPDPFPERAPQTENKVFPSRNKIGEALEEILQITENIFGYNDGRGDLLDDIDTTLGSPVKKAIRAKANKVVKNMIGCKQKKIHEALDLLEEIINELSDSTVDSAYVKRMDNYNNAVKDYKEAVAVHDKDVEKIRAKYSDEDIVNGKADAELDKAAEKVEPYQKALYIADKKFDNMYKLYKNREQRKQGK